MAEATHPYLPDEPTADLVAPPRTAAAAQPAGQRLAAPAQEAACRCPADEDHAGSVELLAAWG